MYLPGNIIISASLIYISCTVYQAFAKSSATICENAQFELRCESGQVLTITGSKYYSRQKSCFAWKNCDGGNVTAPLKKMCNNKRICVVGGNGWMNAAFKDPCFGVAKQLDIFYDCIENNDNAAENADKPDADADADKPEGLDSCFDGEAELIHYNKHYRNCHKIHHTHRSISEVI